MEFQEWFLNIINSIDWYKVSLVSITLLFIKWYVWIDGKAEHQLVTKSQYRPNKKQEGIIIAKHLSQRIG